VFSTQAYKLIATGEGGAIVTDDDTLLDRMRALGGDTRTRTAGPMWRLNCRMSEAHAAMAIPQLDRLDDLVQQLRALQAGITGLFNRSRAVRLVLPSGPAWTSNGSLVGLWFHDPDSASAAAAFLGAAGVRCHRPGAEADLHVARSWPVAARHSRVDLRSYVDVGVPFLASEEHGEFLGELERIVDDLAPALASQPTA
jgi:dTDP-4-amino-4,6-dideoxygalactose transaminase